MEHTWPLDVFQVTKAVRLLMCGRSGTGYDAIAVCMYPIYFLPRICRKTSLIVQLMSEWKWYQSTTSLPQQQLPPLFIYCYNATKPSIRSRDEAINVKFHRGAITVQDIKGLHRQYGKRHHLCIIYDDTLNLMKDLSKDQKAEFVGLFSELSRHLNIRFVVARIQEVQTAENMSLLFSV